MSYKIMAKEKSLYNTGPTYSIYLAGLFFDYMKKRGPIEYWDELARERASLLYDCIENSNGYYSNPVNKRYRSRLNVPFLIKKDDKKLTKKFLEETKKEGLI